MTGLAKSSFYYKPKIDPLERERKDDELRRLIDQVHAEFPGYGYRRISAHLLRLGIRVNHKRIRRVMRLYGLFPIVWQRFRCKTTDSRHSFRIYPNRLPGMTVTGVNQVWVGDITYIRIATCFVYLAVILDLYSRKVVGWAISRSLDRQVCIAALGMAIETRRPAAGLVHHTDRGVQYASDEYIALLDANGIVPSMSAKGYCYDNGAPRTRYGRAAA